MNCGKYEEELALYAMGELNCGKAEELRLHMEGCESCRDTVREYENMMTAFTRSKESDLTEIEKLRLENSVFRHVAARFVLRSKGGRSRLVPYLLRVAAALVVFLFGYGVSHVFDSSNRPVPVTSLQMMSGLTEGEYRYTTATSQLRFSAEGLKLIARGQSALPDKKTRPTDNP
ncbi:MAG: zf-HC2 domain-containing protein [Candidatus Zixiibacteriota bacterium]